MSQFYSQIYFIFVLCALVKVSILHEHGTTEAEFLSSVKPRRNCVERICTCADIPKWDGVVCELDSRSLFPILGFWHFKHLSGKMFQGLRIYSLHLWNPDTTVAENVFEGILGLTRFYVNQSSITVVPDLRVVKDSITLIEMRSSRITSLEGKHLQNLTSVSFLSFFGNLIRYIDPDVFLGTYNVVTLHLSNNKLTSIPPNLLNPMKRLATFSAMYNNLLHVDNLFSVARPLNIFLGFNNITNFSLTQNVENSRWDYIAELDLRNNFIQETSLSLSTCILNNDSILEIRTLNLNGNKLRNLNDVLKCLQNKKLEITSNQIQFLTEKDFISVYKTEQLLLHDNQIHRIDTHTFKPFNTSLQGLDLSSNQITSINGSVKYLTNLIWLALSHNSIQTFTEDEFTGLHSLLALTFEHNQIKSLGMKLQKLEKLQFLNIIHNDIELIKPDQIPKTLKSMELADNPFKCDCNGLPFYKMLHQWRDKGFCLRSEFVNSVRKHLNCPDVCSCKCTEYGGGLSMFVDCSSRNLSLVPNFMENNLTQLQVNEMFSSGDRRYRVMYQNIDPILHLEDNVLGVSLENNNLDILDDAQLPPNLVQLYLSNNKLMRFPQSVIDNQLNLEQVSLSGNPWKCDCDSLKFKKWLTSNSHIIKDYDNVRCGESDIGGTNLNGTVLWELSDLDLCPGLNLTLVFSVLFAALSFLAFCIFAKVVYTIYELNIKLFLYSHGITSVKEEILDYDKVFDAFISFSYKDDEFVIQDIISEIENRDPNIRLCLHYRHFRPGVPITDNITHAVQKSKRTVVILSRNFLESEWCLLEFEIAHNQTLQDKVSRIIVVKVEELPKEIEPTIKLYLKSTTYLTWGESNFWNKLLHVLPSQSSVKRPVLRFVGDSETSV